MNTMILFPGLFINHIPEELHHLLPQHLDKFDHEEYPQWVVFMNLHLGRPLDTSAIEGNARIILGLSAEDAKTVEIAHLVEMGVDLYEPRSLD